MYLTFLNSLVPKQNSSVQRTRDKQLIACAQAQRHNPVQDVSVNLKREISHRVPNDSYLSWWPLKYRKYLLSFKDRSRNDSADDIFLIRQLSNMQATWSKSSKHTIPAILWWVDNCRRMRSKTNQINPILLAVDCFQAPEERIILF